MVSREQTKQKLRSIWAKFGAYKYTLLILLLGVGLMIIPGKAEETELPQTQTTAPATQDLEIRLEELLRRVAGAGEVEVLLTLAEGTAYEYQSDVQESTEQAESQLQKETVLVQRGNGLEEPVTVRTRYPIYRGAVVLCTGADRASVRLDVVKAVSSVTGLGSDKISVIKMKEH